MPRWSTSAPWSSTAKSSATTTICFAAIPAPISARDLAILARALYLTFPGHAALFYIGALELDGKIIRNHNDLLGRYPGADGMKTGFTCAAGFNIVASAT